MKKPKVLIVDDEIDMRIFISTLFATGGYKPVTTRDGGSGLQKAREILPDIIILDVMMPGEGGVAMYQGLKTETSLKHIPVIMLSAVARKTFNHYLKMLDIQTGGTLPGPDAYMEKPPDARELLDLADRLVGRGQSIKGCGQ
jgi:two-component system phosphate regulon response regulator PhoB